MNDLVNQLSASQLRKAAEIKEKIDLLQRGLNALLGGSGGSGGSALAAAPGRGGRRTMSAAHRAKIAAAARARWAKRKGSSGATASAPGKRRSMSPAARRKIAAAARARWERARASGQNHL
ncbi:MAG TPA: hypothetical protein VHH88_11525 [Verrucomicrobiae bacterium]|nr:hypothetical protein [Verrucomicrobiae bacterium]